MARTKIDQSNSTVLNSTTTVSTNNDNSQDLASISFVRGLLINYISENYSQLIKDYTRFITSDPIITEECLSRLAFKLLNSKMTLPNHIDNIPGYLRVMFENIVFNFHTKNMKHDIIVLTSDGESIGSSLADPSLTAEENLIEQVQEKIDSDRLVQINRAINSLPPKQKLAIEYFLQNNEIASISDQSININTQKTNFRFALNSLKGILKGFSKPRSRIKSKPSPYRGVTWHDDAQKWNTQLTHKGKKYNIGYYIDELSAAKAYDSKVLELNISGKQLNFPL